MDMLFDDGFGYWLSGLVDGEGSFGISRKRSKVPGSFIKYHCVLKIKLRCDDRPILEEIQRRTGLGHLHDGKARGWSKPTSAWQVRTKDGCTAMVDLFDRYPLRSKKARDYAIWREAVTILKSRFPDDCRVKRLADRRQLETFHQALRGIRRYVNPQEQATVVPDLFAWESWDASAEPDFVF